MEAEGQGQSDKKPTHCLVEEEFIIGVPLVRPKPLFLKLLRLSGATSEVFTKKEIVQYLKDYISSRQLFDLDDPRVVHCKGDLLGEVFGVRQFTIEDVLGLLEKNCTPVPDTCLKRKRQLVSKPIHSLPASVTISVCHSGPQSSSVPTKTNSSSNREPCLSGSSKIGTTSFAAESNYHNDLNVNNSNSSQEKSNEAAIQGHSACNSHMLELGTNQLKSNETVTTQRTSQPTLLVTCPDETSLPHTKSRLPSTSSISDKQSESSSSVQVNGNRVGGDSKTDDDNQKRGKKKSKKKKRKNKAKEEDGPARKRHYTEPSHHHGNSEEPGPSRLPRRRGTSLSITYADDGSNHEDEYPWYLKLELADRQTNREDDEQSEVYSVQDKETVRVQDSTDDLWFVEEDSFSVEVPSDTDFMVEYDIESDIPAVTESDLSSVKSSEEIVVVCKESDVEFFADCSDSDSASGDNELTEADNWCCADCKNINHPFQRFCGKCWKVRNDWLPREQLTSNSGHRKVKSDDLEDRDLDENAKGMTDSGISSTQFSSQENMVTEKEERGAKSTSANSISLPSLTDFDLSKSLGLESQNLESRYACANIQIENSASRFDPKAAHSPKKLLKSSSEAKASGLEDPCMICLSRPKTASLIHGTTGHQVCCFTCAKRLKRRGQVCPVCRRPIQKVVRNYIL